jgi:hypothetical protein
VLVCSAAFVLITNSYADQFTEVYHQIREKTGSRLVAIAPWGFAVLIVTATITTFTWLAVRGFRLVAYSLRGASHWKISKYPEITDLVRAGYQLPGSMWSWIINATKMVFRK